MHGFYFSEFWLEVRGSPSAIICADQRSAQGGVCVFLYFTMENKLKYIYYIQRDLCLL